MGRGGGGSGGGHSGGGFGGGHSSGGFSGGGRGSSGGFSGGSHSNSGSHYGGARPVHVGPVIYGGGYGRRRGSMNGCGTTVVIVIILLMVSVMISQLSFSSDADVPESTKQRTALSGQVNKTDWYADEIGWVSSPDDLTEGLEDFYHETGIQPYVLFVKYNSSLWNDDGTLNPTKATDYLEKIYAEKFTDEAHFLFAYFQCANDSRNEMDGEFRYLSGYSADTVMDSEAIDILWGYFQIYYNDLSYTMEEMISKTFADTGKRIMSAPTNGWDVAKVVIIAVAAVAVVVVVYLIIRNINKRKKEKAEETQKILNTPLDTFGDDTSDLEDKYQ